jgi:hypothetical protein
MSDNQQDLTLRLQFVADTKGADQASKTIDQLKKTAEGANNQLGDQNKKLQAAGQVAGRAAEQISSVASACGATGGAATQAAAGVRLLSGAINTLVQAGGGLKGLLAAVALLAASALVNWLVKTAAKTKDLKEQAAKTNDVLTAMSKITLDAINTQQEKLRKSSSDTADQYERILAAKNRMMSAQEQADLAQLDYEKAVALSGADKSDPFASRRIEADFAARASVVSSTAERARQNNEISVSESKVNSLRGQASLSDTEADRIAAVKSAAENRMEGLQRRRNISTLTDDERKQLDEDIGNLNTEIKNLAKAIETAQAKADAARSQLSSAELDVLTARTSRAALDIRTRANTREGANAVSALDYDQRTSAQETLAKAKEKQDSAMKRAGELRSDTAAEYGDLRKARSGNGDVEKELAEYKEAYRKEAEFRAEFTKILRETKAETAKALEALKNLPNN